MSEMSPVLITLLVTLVGAMAATSATFLYNLRLRQRDELAKRWALVLALEQRVVLIEMKLGFFWKGVEETLADRLKQPTHYVMDQLIDKFQSHTITLDECYELFRWISILDAEPPTSHDDVLLRHVVKSGVFSLMLELEKAKREAEDQTALPPPPPPTWSQRVTAAWRRFWAHLVAAWTSQKGPK